MMPKAPQKLANPALVKALKAVRTKQPPTTWDAFRQSKCGKACFEELQHLHGERCVYSDHSPGRTIDHVKAKATKPAEMLKWSNWLLACGDCNRDKGNHAGLVNPLAHDPRDSIQFTLVTGKPGAIGQGATRKRGVKTLSHIRLDQETFNEARKARVLEAMDAIQAFLAGQLSQVELMAEFHRSKSNRAILRDLLLEQNPVLNPYQKLVNQVVAQVPALQQWATDPLQHGG